MQGKNEKRRAYDIIYSMQENHWANLLWQVVHYAYIKFE